MQIKHKAKASRFVGVFLSVCMTASLMAQMCVPAAAADVPDPVGASFVKDGITYYNVYSTNFDSDKRFYEDLIDKKSVLLDIDGSSGAKKYSIADMWFLTQLGIFDKMGLKYGPSTHSDDHFAEVISVGKKAILNGSTSGKYGDYPYDDWKWTYTVSRCL